MVKVSKFPIDSQVAEPCFHQKRLFSNTSIDRLYFYHRSSGSSQWVPVDTIRTVITHFFLRQPLKEPILIPVMHQDLAHRKKSAVGDGQGSKKHGEVRNVIGCWLGFFRRRYAKGRRATIRKTTTTKLPPWSLRQKKYTWYPANTLHLISKFS